MEFCRNALTGIFCFGTATENSRVTLQSPRKFLRFFLIIERYVVKVHDTAYALWSKVPQ